MNLLPSVDWILDLRAFFLKKNRICNYIIDRGNDRTKMLQRHISFDWAMKKLLRSKANFGILEGFLTELIGQEIKILEILES